MEQIRKINIDDYTFCYIQEEYEELKKHIPTAFKKDYIDHFNSGKVDNPIDWDGERRYKDGEDYAFTWAYEILADLYGDAFSWLMENSQKYNVEVEFSDESKEKWKQIWEEQNKWMEDDELDCDIDHIAVATDCDTVEEFLEKLPDNARRFYWEVQLMKEVPTEEGMQPIWNLYIKYRKEAHAIQDRINGENYTDWYLNRIVPWMESVKKSDSQYKNWPDDEELPEDWEVIDGWAMPEDVAAFFPGDENLYGSPIFYLHDDMWWDLENNCYTEN